MGSRQGAQPEPITNEPELWTYYRPRPADDPSPAERAQWTLAQAMWELRLAHPELKSGRMLFLPITTDDPAVYAFLHEKDGAITLVALNFRWEAVTCQVRIDWTAAEITPPTGTWSPQELISNTPLPPASAAHCAQGYPLTIPCRDGVVVKCVAKKTAVDAV